MKTSTHTFVTPTLAALCLAVGWTPSAVAQTTLLFEDFNSLTQAEYEAEWTVPTQDVGGTIFPISFIETPTDPFSLAEWPDLDEIAISHYGQANIGLVEWKGLDSSAPINPTATQNIKLSVDIFDNASGNKRMSLGLRNASTPSHLIELGFWNSDPSGYAHRAILFPTTEENPNPNWAGFDLDLSLDREDDLDDIVDSGDIGAGWHNYTAIIGVDSLTIELDLFRNGINEVTEAAGPDATVTYALDSNGANYDSLRLGGPSGVSSAGSGELGGGVLYDNILLQLVDVVTSAGLAGDFNDNGSVEQADLDLVLGNWGASTTPATFLANIDGLSDGVDQDELDAVLSNWGSSVAPAFNGVAVPEPATAAALAGLGILALRRRSA